ncbi:MAG: hypothetical protein PHW53_02295 [Patescibacteria group bacterium]|nr:hypothetical protein [Patescibacteria group bacterium]
MNQVLKIIIVALIAAIIIGGGYYFWQKNQATQSTAGLGNTAAPAGEELPDPLLYSTAGLPVSVSKNAVLFDYTVEQLEGMAGECGSQHDPDYFDELILKFVAAGATKHIYNLKYSDASQEPDTFVITLLPNEAGYASLDQFKKDFDICAAGGDAYPTMLSENWLLFVNSCGSGFDDGSGRPIGCEKVREIVEPTLKLR